MSRGGRTTPSLRENRQHRLGPAVSQSQPVDKQRYDLQIVLVNVQLSFGLARVKKSTTVFEIKQAIEKLKQFRIEMQSLSLPDYLADHLRTKTATEYQYLES